MVLSKASSPIKPAVSIVVLAYNEAKNLPDTIATIQKTISDKFPRYEIIIVNDGSRDDTGAVAEKLAGQDSRLKVVHNNPNRGCGYTFFHGVGAASGDYVWLLPGDGEITASAMDLIAGHIGKADMIIPYAINSNIRPLGRRVVSWGYTTFINTLFFKRIHYYNGPMAIRTDLVKSVPQVNSRGFAFTATILLRLMRQKKSYIQVGFLLQPRVFGQPSIGSLKNIKEALGVIMRFYWDINIMERFGKKQARPG
jgi:glycosyltransferase involved in cell wall biosynthesis